jgi:hypothetical protein
VSSIETQPLTPPQPVDGVWEFTDDPAIGRRAVRILAAQYRHQRLVLGAFVVFLVFAALAATTGVQLLYGVAAAALGVVVVAWALWFARWA